MIDNERIQQINEWAGDGNDSSLMNKDGVRFLLQQIEHRDKTIVELSSIYASQFGAELQRRTDTTLSALEQISTCIDAFIRDCKKHKMEIPFDMYYGTYADLQAAYVQAGDAISHAKGEQ